jgi:hypothetical protein
MPVMITRREAEAVLEGYRMRLTAILGAFEEDAVGRLVEAGCDPGLTRDVLGREVAEIRAVVERGLALPRDAAARAHA